MQPSPSLWKSSTHSGVYFNQAKHQPGNLRLSLASTEQSEFTATCKRSSPRLSSSFQAANICLLGNIPSTSGLLSIPIVLVFSPGSLIFPCSFSLSQFSGSQRYSYDLETMIKYARTPFYRQSCKSVFHGAQPSLLNTKVILANSKIPFHTSSQSGKTSSPRIPGVCRQVEQLALLNPAG